MITTSHLFMSMYYFFMYSFLGWLMESTLNTLKQKTFINRGFLLGPYCPIYGIGMGIIYLICSTLGTHPLLVFISGTFFATLLEYLTGILMEKLFHAKWWDYSPFPYNLKGYICLHVSLAWGLLSTVFICYINPLIQVTTKYILLTPGPIFLIILCIIFIVDFAYSTYTAFKLASKFSALSELQLRERLVQTLSKYHIQLNKLSAGEKRLIKAFPTLRLSSIKTLKDKWLKK